MPVMASAGVVGRVQRVFGAYCDVLLAADPESSIDVVVPRTGGRGVLKGIAGERSLSHAHRVSRAQGRSGRGRPGGHRGLGGVFPRDLAVGKIVKVDKRDFGLYQEAEVEPAVDFGKLRDVLVVVPRAAAAGRARRRRRASRRRAPTRSRDAAVSAQRAIVDDRSPSGVGLIVHRRRCRRCRRGRRCPTPGGGAAGRALPRRSAAAARAPAHVARGARPRLLADLFAGAPKGLHALTLGAGMVLARARVVAARSWPRRGTRWYRARRPRSAHGALRWRSRRRSTAATRWLALRLVPLDGAGDGAGRRRSCSRCSAASIAGWQPDPRALEDVVTDARDDASRRAPRARTRRRAASPGRRSPSPARFVLLVGRLWQLQVMSGELLHAQERRQLRQGARAAGDARPDPRSQGARARRQPPRVQRLRHAALLHRPTRSRRLKQVPARSTTTQATALEVEVAAEARARSLPPAARVRGHHARSAGAARVEKNELPGVAVQAVAHRNYPHGTLAAHVLGYMNQITRRGAGRQAAARRHAGYHLGDYVGRAGLERQWESFLRGKDGVERIVVDAKGQRKDVEPSSRRCSAGRSASSRSRATTSSPRIDLDLQKVVETALAQAQVGAPPRSSRSTPAACWRWRRGPSPIPTCSPAASRAPRPTRCNDDPRAR